jgi:CO dehydrogenase/acetyl-CoA synthase beta subunit
MPTAKKIVVDDARKLRDKLERAVELKRKRDDQLESLANELKSQQQVCVVTNQYCFFHLLNIKN